MLQKLGDHITSCLERAADAERRGSETSDLESKAETERMANAWRHLARSYEFVESLERFLLDAWTKKNTLPPSPPRCPKCNQDLRLLGIEESDNSGELFTFECTNCGHLEVMGAPVE